MKISEIAYLQSGLVLTRKEARCLEETQFTYKRLNLRSLHAGGTIDKESLDLYLSKELLDKSILTQKNDIIVKLFAPISPTLINDESIGLVIPSQLAVIRIKNHCVVPEYLCYILSSSDTIERLLISEGLNAQRTVKLGDIANLDVPVPPLEKQQIIVSMISTNKKREMLYRQLIDEQNRLLSYEIKKIIGGN